MFCNSCFKRSSIWSSFEEFVDTFTFQTFEPRGMVEGHENIKMSNSIIDYVFRALGLDRTDI